MVVHHIKQQAFIVQALWAVLLTVGIVALFLGRWSIGFAACLTLALALAPVVLARRYNVVLPLAFTVATTLFLIASIFLGEVFDYYNRFWWWDLALHGFSAVGFGLIGFTLVLMMFEGDRFAAPHWAMCLMGFAFAVTVGAVWEIFEFAADSFFGLNMQKSGLDDTMGDLILDVAGAGLASWIGYVFLRSKERSVIGSPIDRFIALNKKLFRKFR